MIGVDIGGMRDRIEIQEPREAADAYGASVRSWVTVATVWAKVEAKESVPLPDDAQSMGVRHEVEIRFFAGLTHRHRLRLLPVGRLMDINGVLDVGNLHVVMRLDCLEKIRRT